MARLPTKANGPAIEIPRLQWAFDPSQETRQDDENWEKAEMQRWEVKEAFRYAWEGYKKHAWGWDELLPVSGGRRNIFNGWGATLVDSLDTLWIMDMKDEFHEAVRHVAKIDFNNLTHPNINLFETNIRYLGGLIAAHELSGEKVLLAKATELGHLLYAAFDTQTHMPMLPYFSPQHALQGRQQAPGAVSSAALGTLSMEFTRLSQLSGEPKFYDAIDRIKKFLLLTQETSRIPGMWPMTLDLHSKKQNGGKFTVGAEADSLYEYLPKMYLLLEGRDKAYQTLWLRAASAIQQNLLFKPMVPHSRDLLFAGSVINNGGVIHKLLPETGHLDCFIGGLFALGGRVFDLSDHLADGVRLAAGCAWAYEQFPTGVMPESLALVPCPNRNDFCKYNEAMFENGRRAGLPEGISAARDRRYLLRPEAIESLFIAFRTTGQYSLQKMAWEMFQAVRNTTHTAFGNAQLKDVLSGEEHEDTMESFWLGETLKYFYLIFSPPDLISLDEWVFNTEAHPFKWRTGPVSGVQATSVHAGKWW